MTEPLTFARLRHINTQRCKSPKGFGHPIHDWSLSDWMVATLGELGEAANIAKKLNRFRDGIRGNKEGPQELAEKLQDEIGDTLVYLDLLAASQGFTLEEAVIRVFNRKSEELGSQYKL